MTKPKCYVNASELGAILGVDHWRDPIDVYRDKLSPPASKDKSERQEWGDALESVIAAQWSRGAFTLLAGETLQRFNGQLRVRPDFIAHRQGTSVQDAPAITPSDPGARVIEVKNVSERQLETWEKDGIPMSYQYQGQAYMLATHLKLCTFVVLFGGNTLREFHLKADDIVQTELIVAVATFCECVKKENPPPTPETHRNYVRQETSAEDLELEDLPMLNALIFNRAQRKKLEDEAKRLTECLKSVVGEKMGLRLGGKLIAGWSDRSRKESIVPAKTYRQFDVKPNTVLNRAVADFTVKMGHEAQREPI
jgi:predicted phage-related endonuclease